jgi:hypothetical protein
MAFYISSFQDAMQQFVTFFKSFFSFQASSNDSGGGLCLYPSMTTKGTIAIQISIYAIIVLDFLVLAYFWPRIRTPVLSFVERQVFLSDSRSTVLQVFLQVFEGKRCFYTSSRSSSRTDRLQDISRFRSAETSRGRSSFDCS